MSGANPDPYKNNTLRFRGVMVARPAHNGNSESPTLSGTSYSILTASTRRVVGNANRKKWKNTDA